MNHKNDRVRSKGKGLFKGHPFQFNQQLQRTTIPKRLSKFVVIPGNPISSEGDLSGMAPIPSPHYLELIQMAESTLLFLSEASTRTGRVCPKAIFSQKGPELERYTVPHQLKTYLNELQSERQHAFEFHFVGHGTQHEIGLSMWQRGISDIEFAHQIKKMLEDDALNTLDFHHRPIHFIFHTCNSAYCEIDPSMTTNDIHTAVKNESFIGRFYTQMKQFGLENIQVSGFRGYYSHALSHKASMVTDAYDCHTVLLPADSAKFTIFANGQVQMPSNMQGCFMPIHISDPFTETDIISDPDTDPDTDAEQSMRTDTRPH